MRKRIFAGVLSVALMGTIALPVSAENIQMKVQYGKISTYTLTIPGTTRISADAATTTEISFSDVNTKPNEKVQVKISDGLVEGNKVELTRMDDKDTKVFSLVTMDESAPVISDTVILSAGEDVVKASKTLNFSAIKDSAGGTVKAGIYEGTLTFLAGYVTTTGE